MLTHNSINSNSCFLITISMKEVRFALPLIILLLSTLWFSYVGTPYDVRFLNGFGFLSYFFPNINGAHTSSSSSSSSSSSLSSSSSSARDSCDYSKGRWVWDETNYPNHSYTENCPFLDPGFRCRLNRRPDESFRQWRWQPQGCDIPRFNARELLERSRNGRIVFAGDSVGRNQWESLLCMLTQGVTNVSTIYEVNGKPISKHKGYLSMRFPEFNLTVEYYRTPFLSLIGPPPLFSSPRVLKTIRLDKLHWFSRKWIGADLLIFNSGHWWQPDKTTRMGCFFQQGSKVNMTMDAMEAFRRSIYTWKSWAMTNLDPNRSTIFFRGYSPMHYKFGEWKDGGRCDMETEPETDITKIVTQPYDYNNQVISDVVKQMQNQNWHVEFLNITYMSVMRKDGHPSKYREQGTPPNAPQDCSHWCLPGVPDTWNHLLYAQLISNKFRAKASI